MEECYRQVGQGLVCTDRCSLFILHQAGVRQVLSQLLRCVNLAHTPETPPSLPNNLLDNQGLDSRCDDNDKRRLIAAERDRYAGVATVQTQGGPKVRGSKTGGEFPFATLRLTAIKRFSNNSTHQI